MAIKEEVTNQIVITALLDQLVTEGETAVGAIIDTKDYDNGIYFVPYSSLYTTGEFTLILEHGNDAGLSDATIIPEDQLVYGNLPVISSGIIEGTALKKEGVFGNKRYLRASMIGTGAGATALVGVLAIVNPEIGPTSQDSL